MRRYEGNLTSHLSVKEASLERLHCLSFQLEDIPEKAKLWRQYKDPWLPGIGEEETRSWWNTEDITAVKLLCVVL